MRAIDTIIFDLGGVLIDYDLERCLTAFRRLGIPHPEEMINPYKQEGIFLGLEQGTLSAEAFCEEVRGITGRALTNEQIEEAWCSFLLTIPPYKLDMLRELRAKGYRVMMLSNTNPIMFNYMREGVFRSQGLTIDAYFDRLFLSFEMKRVKPHADIFEAMIVEGEIEPARSLFIDDGEANVATAAQLGFHTYLAAANQDFRPLFEQYVLR